MLKAYHLKCKNILKSHPKIPKKKLEEFRRTSNVLFDISSCKCKNMEECVCPRHKKVPAIERSFLIDQRTTRRMVIGTLDLVETAKKSKTVARKIKRQKSLVRAEKKKKTPSNAPKELLSRLFHLDRVNLTRTSSDDIFQPRPQASSSAARPRPEASSLAELDFALLSRTCDRYGLSDRAGAAVA